MDKKTEQERLKARLSASESSHFYKQDGSPCHEIEKVTKPGEYRAVNKTDAAKLGLVPSVTNLLGRYRNRSGIEKWSRSLIYDKLAMDPDRLMRLANAEADEFDSICREVDAEAEAEAKTAADLGSLFHYYIENAIARWTEGSAVTDLWTKKLLKKVCPEISDSAALSFSHVFHKIISSRNRFIPMDPDAIMQEFALAWNILATVSSRGDSENIPFGIGGKFDLIVKLTHGTAAYDNIISTVRRLANDSPIWDGLYDTLLELDKGKKPINVLVDWKTRKPTKRKTSDKISFPSYPSDAAQLASYAHGASRSGVRVHVACNIFIASDAISISPDEFDHPRDTSLSIETRFYTPEELESGLKYLNAAAAMWHADEQSAHHNAARNGKTKPIFIPVVEDE